MFIFRSPRGQAAGPAPASVRLALGACGCGDPNTAAGDPSRRISSHRTSQGHVVYYRCDCGVTRMKLVRWTTEPATGASRLR